MITLFTCPRAFEGHTGIIQANALSSWARLGFGHARPLVWLSDGSPLPAWNPTIPVECDTYGTPYVSSVFERGEAEATTPILAYINADIILMSDFLLAVERAATIFPGPFLLVGRRFDLDITARLDFAPGWEADMRNQIAARGDLHQAAGIDYFVYRRGVWGEIPPFVLGRWRWDNWLVWHALDRGFPVIDGTAMITAVHQNHGHEHHGTHGAVQRQRNDTLVRLTGGHLCTIDDATHVLTQDNVKMRR